MCETKKATQKQLAFINKIENDWGYLPFEGKTKTEATKYISKAIKEKEREDFEDEAMNFSYPDR